MRAAVAAAFLAAVLPVIAQDCHVSPLQVVPAREGFRLTDRIAFVVDVSGSMKGKLDQAIDSVMMILGGSDDCQATLYTFTDSAVRWPGRPEKCRHDEGQPCTRRCVREGWARFPERLEEARDWLHSFQASGGTQPESAVRAALDLQVPGLVVVLVSDGEFTVEPVSVAVVQGQVKRQFMNVGEAGIMIWGAGDKARESKPLLTLAEIGGGGMWVHDAQISGPW